MPLTDAEIHHEAVVKPWRAYVETPDLRVIERPGWMQIITPSVGRGGNNGVAHAEMSEAEADEVIDRVIAEYAAAGVRWRWTVGPGSRPADLGARLEARGMALHRVTAVARSTAGVEQVPGVAVERVDERTVDEYTQVIAAGWEFDPIPLAAFHRHAVRSPRHRLYLARIDGTACAAGLSVWFDRSIYLQSGVVVASFRGRGAYRALVAARLADAAAGGIELATSQARPETSGPILEGMGFHVVDRFTSYNFP